MTTLLTDNATASHHDQ